MSTAKRLRHQSGKTTPAAKRVKVSKTSHVPAKPQGLEFLVDEDAREGRKLEARVANGTSGVRGMRVDESRAGVAPDARDDMAVGGSQKNAIDISSAEDESESQDEEDDEEEEDDARPAVNGVIKERPVTNGHVETKEDNIEDGAMAGAEDTEMADHHDRDQNEGYEGEREELSFGDLLQARHPDPIDVHSAFPDPMADRQALMSTGGNALSAPSGSTLRTVLTQALKTNDRDLLERCFQTTNLNDIRLTIERLSSNYAAALLQRLAERIHKRPGRTGNLITWVQWSLVAHGAFLASQPEVMKKLRSLSQVLRERANGLQPLLRLKGKLDMLQAQLELRQRLQAASRAANAEDEEDEEDVVYVEGRDADWTDGQSGAEEDDDVEAGLLTGHSLKGQDQTITSRSDVSDSEDESESDAGLPNGVAQEEMEDETDEEDEQNGILDIEAEETSDDDAEEDDDDAESEGVSDEGGTDLSGDESDDGVKEPKPQMLNRKR